MLEGEKNILQAQTPRKKIHWELKGWKKIHANTKSPNPPPTPPSEVKWLAPYVLIFSSNYICWLTRR